MKRSIKLVVILVLTVCSYGYGQDSIVLSIEQARAADSLLTALEECEESAKELNNALTLYRDQVHVYRAKDILWEQKDAQYLESQRIQIETLKVSEAEIKSLKRKNRHLKFTLIGMGIAATGATVGLIYMAFN